MLLVQKNNCVAHFTAVIRGIVMSKKNRGHNPESLIFILAYESISHKPFIVERGNMKTSQNKIVLNCQRDVLNNANAQIWELRLN